MPRHVHEQHRVAVRGLNVGLNDVLRHRSPLGFAVQLIKPVSLPKDKFCFDGVGVVATELIPTRMKSRAFPASSAVVRTRRARQD